MATHQQMALSKLWEVTPTCRVLTELFTVHSVTVCTYSDWAQSSARQSVCAGCCGGVDCGAAGCCGGVDCGAAGCYTVTDCGAAGCYAGVDCVAAGCHGFSESSQWHQAVCVARHHTRQIQTTRREAVSHKLPHPAHPATLLLLWRFCFGTRTNVCSRAAALSLFTH